MNEHGQQVARDPFSDVIPERAWLNITNPDVRSKPGTVRIALEVNGQEKEIFNQYVIDGTVSHSNNLTWLVKNAVAAKDARIEQLEEALQLILVQRENFAEEAWENIYKLASDALHTKTTCDVDAEKGKK